MTSHTDWTMDPLTAELHVLHDDHVRAVNAALEAGREDLALELAEQYPDAALRVLAGTSSR